MRGVIVAILLAAVGGVAYALRAGDGDNGRTLIFDVPTAQSSVSPEPGTGPLDDRAPVVGQPAPDFVLREIGGSPMRLSDLRGKVVFVNFWATWCRPCKRELPDIQALSREFPDDLAVLTINVEESADEARAFLEENDLALPALLDHSGAVYRQYRLPGLPGSFFIDREGNLAAIQYGYLTQEMMRERLGRAGLFE